VQKILPAHNTDGAARSRFAISGDPAHQPPHTPSVHVSSIVAGLGVSTRAEAATVHRMHVMDGR
jgi:hypothetical protein